MTEKVGTISKQKHLFYILASALFVSMLLISCRHGSDIDDVPDIFAVDISQETDWNYMVVGKDGSSMVYKTNESTGIPTLLYLKPKKDSDDGFTYVFKENGLPDKIIAKDHILYFGNFNGYKFDLAIIYPNDTIEYFYDIETDTNWDAYNERSVSGQGRSMSGREHGIGVATCIGGLFFEPLLLACTSYVVKLYVDTVTTYVFPELAGAGDVLKTIIDALDCVTGTFDTVVEMFLTTDSCISAYNGMANLLSSQDTNLIAQKTTQIKEVIRKLEGDGLTSIPSELLAYFFLLGIDINNGRNPPTINGTYLATPLQLVNTTTRTSIATQWDMYVTFSEQNNVRMTVNTTYLMQSDNGSMNSGGIGSYIVGEGNKFTVFQDGMREELGYTAKTVEVYSGEMTATGIRNFQWAVFMIDNKGDPLGHWIANGTGYFKRDSDGFSEKINSTSLITPLPNGQWVNGYITSTAGNAADFYSIQAIGGINNYIWWDDSDNTDGLLDIKVSVYNSNWILLSDWDTPNYHSFGTSGTVYIKVYPYNTGDTGAYRIAYSTSSAMPRSISESVTSLDQTVLKESIIDGVKKQGATFGGFTVDTSNMADSIEVLRQ